MGMRTERSTTGCAANARYRANTTGGPVVSMRCICWQWRAARAAEDQARPRPVPAHHQHRAAQDRPWRRRGRGAPRRQVPAALKRPDAVGRRHRAGLQAAAASRARLAGHEEHPRSATGALPPRGPHPHTHPALLACAAAHPHHRTRNQRHLAQHPQRAAAPAPRHVHQPSRHLPTTH